MAAVLAGLLAASLVTLVAGLALKLRAWASRPLPPGAVLAPAPHSRVGAMRRVAAEVLLFRSLLRASPWTWAFAMAFHVGLALIFLGHVRWLLLPGLDFGWLKAAALVLYLAGLGGLLARRLLVDRLRYISTASDYLWIALLTALALSGGWLGAAESDLAAALRAWLLGARALPADFVVLAHIGLACVLFSVFPFSKMLHAPGIVAQPARTGVDRDRRA